MMCVVLRSLNLFRQELLLLFLFTVCGGPVSAAPEEIRSVEISFHCLHNHYVEDPGLANLPMIKYYMDDEWVQVESAWGRTSTPMVYVGLSPMRVKLALGVGGPVQELEVQLEEQVTSILLVIFPVENQRFVVFPLDTSEGIIPDGEATVINLSGERLAVNVAKESHSLEPGQRWHVPMDAGTHFQLKTQIAAEYKDRWRLVYRGMYSVDPSRRALMLVHRQNFIEGAITVSHLPMP